jgi:bifunctional DNA-binding transcriptional regulator/antitoxin component of YhaV-PrlF toxin-antitoxin module
MEYKVGTKGQIVIDKQIREKLGVEPGWIALQILVGERVEIAFVPPEHNESLHGSLARYATADKDSGTPASAKATAWHAAAADKDSGHAAEANDVGQATASEAGESSDS